MYKVVFLGKNKPKTCGGFDHNDEMDPKSFMHSTGVFLSTKNDVGK